ncbi:hypothetical protein Tco_1345821 [Tanacetum coccineum]
MVSTMTTRNAGRRIAATRGRGISEQDGQEGERSRDQAGNGRGGQGSGRGSQGNGRGGQGSSRGNKENGGGGRVPDFATIITQRLQNLLPTIVAQVGNHVNNQGNNENQDDNVINDNNQASHAKYTNRFHELARLVPHLVTPENKRIERAGPRMVTPVNARNPTAAHGACFECGGTDHYKAACPRLNRAPRLGGNRPHQVMAIEGGQGRGNNGNKARGEAFMIRAEEACRTRTFPVQYVVDSCRTGKIVEDDLVSTMRKKLTLETGDGATKTTEFWRIDNRSAQQSRVRKLQYISELERNVNSLQGALDCSLDFHHNEKRFLGFSRGTSSLDADVHRKHIYVIGIVLTCFAETKVWHFLENTLRGDCLDWNIGAIKQLKR